MMKLRNLENKLPQFGISIYPNKATEKELLDYLSLAKKYGFTRVFTNLIGLSITDLEKFKSVCLAGSKMGMKMIADIDETVLEALKVELTDTNFFKEIGIGVIRLDVKFDAEKVAALSKNKEGIELEINASDFSKIEEEIITFDHNKNHLVASHNFFPQLLTGLNYEKFQTANDSMKKSQFRISAFVSKPGEDVIDAWDESEGSVTLEACRTLSLKDQFQLLIAQADIDFILVSNMYLKESDFKEISELQVNKIEFNGTTLSDVTDTEKEIFHYGEHKLRGDNPSSLMFRSTISRKVFSDKDVAPKSHGKKFFEPGDVIIANNKYGRYKGELHIIKTQIPASSKKNLVGKISKEQLELLNLPRPLLLFTIKKEGE